jgi:predicted metal-dependent hydrolase
LTVEINSGEASTPEISSRCPWIVVCVPSDAQLRKYGIGEPKLCIGKMKKRWGSCTGRGVIYLNPGLIKAPSHCIDYIITHELCHLKYPNHGKQFYSLMSRVMPDWGARKRRLESVPL